MRRQWMNYGDATGDRTATIYQFACGSVTFFAPDAPTFSLPAQPPVQIAYYGAMQQFTAIYCINGAFHARQMLNNRIYSAF